MIFCIITILHLLEENQKKGSKMIITREQFRGFRAMQGRGNFNMYDMRVRETLKISKDQHKYIIAHYDDLDLLFRSLPWEKDNEKQQ